MNIIEQINEKINYFRQEYCKHPNFIIAGENKIMELGLFFDDRGEIIMAAGCKVITLRGEQFKNFLEVGC